MKDGAVKPGNVPGFLPRRDSSYRFPMNQEPEAPLPRAAQRAPVPLACGGGRGAGGGVRHANKERCIGNRSPGPQCAARFVVV